MKIGRNDPCPCGSGKKYKYCCMNLDQVYNREFDKIRELTEEKGYDAKLAEAIIRMSRYIKNRTWLGCCFSANAALYVMLRELGYTPELCMGEVQSGQNIFDHAWLELDHKIFDITAPYMIVDSRPAAEHPVICNVDLYSKEEHELIYGAILGKGLDEMAAAISKRPFAEFMDRFPEMEHGLWSLVEQLTPETVDIEALRVKYEGTVWNVIDRNIQHMKA